MSASDKVMLGCPRRINPEDYPAVGAVVKAPYLRTMKTENGGWTVTGGIRDAVVVATSPAVEMIWCVPIQAGEGIGGLRINLCSKVGKFAEVEELRSFSAQDTYPGNGVLDVVDMAAIRAALAVFFQINSVTEYIDELAGGADADGFVDCVGGV